MRREIGPAYERSPAERFGHWASDNLMRLAVGIAIVVAFTYAVDFFGVKLCNFLETSGHDEIAGSFSREALSIRLTKIIGSVVLIYGLVVRRLK